MTRKHFANIASTLGASARREGLTVEQTKALANGMVPALLVANSNFRRGTFVTAVLDAYHGIPVAYATVC